MTDTFTWDAQAVEGTELTSVLAAQFGDGYEQIAANGINTAVETWNLTWTGKRKDVAKIRAFLRTHIIESFWWTNPWGERNLYRVVNDSIAPTFTTASVASLSFSFKQSFKP